MSQVMHRGAEDKYRDFTALSRAERQGVDFDIVCRATSSMVAIIAPHGGKIESGAAEIAAAMAGDDFNLYCFRGLKPRHNTRLHITSGRFDEPRCRALLSACDHVVAIHGCAAGNRTTFLGGLDAKLRDAIGGHLEAARLRTGIHPDPRLQGISPDNICNRGRRDRGVQLELSRDLRNELMDDGGALARFAAAIRAAFTSL
jgi:phage replication-related protein YjqB (UPF0714/DUF867 family)